MSEYLTSGFGRRGKIAEESNNRYLGQWVKSMDFPCNGTYQAIMLVDHRIWLKAVFYQLKFLICYACPNVSQC